MYSHSAARVLNAAVVALLPWIAGGGCSYVDAIAAHPAPADTRILLGRHERRQVHKRELGDYRCEDGYVLVCDRGRAITYSCTCALTP